LTVGFEQAAIYRPKYSAEGLPIAAPDEDAFTMAVAAVEALRPESMTAGPKQIRLVGNFRPELDWAFPLYFGAPTEVVRHPGTTEGLLAAVREGGATSAEQRFLVVGVDPSGPRGAEAIALVFGPNPTPNPPEWTGSGGVESGTSYAVAALERARHDPAPPASSRTGGSPPWPVDRGHAFASASPTQVSEGAYVPRPRYVENLPSRWRLEADRCARCEQITFPRRGRCRFCGLSDRLSPMTLPRDGAQVVATTVIGRGGQPTEFDPQVEALGPYEVVLAELAPGVRLTLQVTDASAGELRIGQRIGTRLRRLYPMEGEWRYGRKAVPG
jgi:uncharacterized OB-fold protein